MNREGKIKVNVLPVSIVIIICCIFNSITYGDSQEATLKSMEEYSGEKSESQLEKKEDTALFIPFGGELGIKKRSVIELMSEDGDIVVGNSSGEQFFWTLEKGMVSTRKVLGQENVFNITGISRNGSYLIGTRTIEGPVWSTNKKKEAVIWSNRNSWIISAESLLASRYIKRKSDYVVVPKAVSNKGDVVTGTIYNPMQSKQEAFLWTKNKGIAGLKDLEAVKADLDYLEKRKKLSSEYISPWPVSGYFDSTAVDISLDGKVVVGTSNSKAFYWTASGGMKALTDQRSDAISISCDGSVIAGNMIIYDNVNRKFNGIQYRSFRWSRTEGLNFLTDEEQSSQVHDISASGRVIVGSIIEGQNKYTAFLWDKKNGARELKSVLEKDFGLNLTGWELIRAMKISDDGKKIVGFGLNPEGDMEGWMVIFGAKSKLEKIQTPVVAVARRRVEFYSQDKTKVLFFGIGDFSGGKYYSEIRDISADGSMIVGNSSAAFNNISGFYRTHEKGMQKIEVPSSYYLYDKKKSVGLHVQSVSANGKYIVGELHIDDYVSIGIIQPFAKPYFRYFVDEACEGDRLIYHDCYNTISEKTARGVSNQGIAVGCGTFSLGRCAYLWSKEKGFYPLGQEKGYWYNSHANDISADGKTIVGYYETPQGTEAFCWSREKGRLGLGDLPGGKFESVANAVSGDGKIVVGYSVSSSGTEAFCWNAEEGMQRLGDLPGGKYFSEAVNTTNDGSIVVGASHIEGEYKAFIWDRKNGMRNLEVVLTNDFGIDLKGWKLHLANGISDDGKIIVGNGVNPAGYHEGWIVDWTK